MEYDYQKTEDGYDFKASYLDDEENAAKIQQSPNLKVWLIMLTSDRLPPMTARATLGFL